jgi:tRNA G18 (ribose-2'-O)-methylase SpoU
LKKLSYNQIQNTRLDKETIKSAIRFPVAVLLANVRSLYNVGSIFRTCDSAMISELLLCGFTPYPPRAEIEKTALGAVDTVPWIYIPSVKDGINHAKESGYRVIALEITDNPRSYTSLNKEELPICLVLGNELTGVDNEVLELCDDSIEIEMYGMKHSLNVSVAAGIAIFETIKLCKTN